MIHPSLVLASQSPRRSQILTMLGFNFSVVTPPFEEVWPEALTPREVPEFLARGKAMSIQAKEDSVVLASDTVVVLGNQVLGKPQDAGEALEMLKRLNGKTHEVFTGIAVARMGVIKASAVEATRVTFTESSLDALRAYAESKEPLDKAGAYAIQGLGARWIERIEGCFYNVMGLPIQRTLRALAEEGIIPWEKTP